MILTILQARVSSTRLPGKVLRPILGEPMLVRQLERIRHCQILDKIIIATSEDPSDDPLENLAQRISVDYFRGSLNDVLNRFYQAARNYLPDHIVRLTGDCPLADPQLIDEIVSFHLQGNFDYSSNTVEPSFPDGLDVEVCRFSCLEEAWRKASLPSHREHVMPFLHQQPQKFKIGSFKNNVDLSTLRWTVDEEADFELVTKIYEALYPGNSRFTTEDILRYLEENPKLATWNTHYRRNEGWAKSMQQDKKFLTRK